MRGAILVGKLFVTTPIYYVNAEPHVGNAFTTIAADVVARYHRLRGEEVLFATGDDENAPKVARAAEEKGLEPKRFVDQMAAAFKQTWAELNISYDDFIQTTEGRHRRAVQAFVEKLSQAGEVYLGRYEGWYCLHDETFLPESDLVDGCCPNPECRRPAQRLAEPAFFFRFSAYRDRLLEHISRNPDFISPESRRNEVVSFLERGLRDQCISRRDTWGTPFPASVPGAEGMVVYVWVDALINYLTVAGYPDDGERFLHWWPADLHLMAKDILVRFHATLWPAMLMAAGLPLPRQMFGHGWWNVAGEKMSKSKGRLFTPGEVVAALVAQSGCQEAMAVDALRYFLLREVPFGLDGEFSLEAVIGRFDADLANDLGNLLNRTLPLIQRHCGGKLPGPAAAPLELWERAQEAFEAVDSGFSRLDFTAALRATWAFLAAANRYLDKQAPWALAKAGKRQELDSTLYAAAEAIRLAALLVSPVMPSTAEAIAAQLGLERQELSWEEGKQWGLLPAGLEIRPGPVLFPRIQQKPRRQAAAPTSSAGKEPALITFQEFQKLDLRVGEIEAAEGVPGADKLLKLTVNLGAAKKTMVAGIALSYRPEELVGKRVVVVANLAPATIRGIRSEGMILAGWVEGDEGTISLVIPERELPPGSQVK
jgi:methionyl-tRNA synthetase